MTASVRSRVSVFAGVVLVISGYAVVEVMNVDPTHRYGVTLHVVRGGGIFPGAVVDYRGQAVGRVRSVTAGPDDVTVALSLDSRRRVPADVTATITSLSALGEQYVSLQPRTDAPEGGPRLVDRAVLGLDRTAEGLETAALLGDTQRLLTSIRPADLRVVVNELATAFAGTGPQLREILRGSTALLDELRSAEPATVDLLAAGRTVLTSAVGHRADFATFSASLADLSARLRDADPTLRSLLATAPGVVGQVAEVLTRDASGVGLLLGNLAAGAQIGAVRVPALQAFTRALPYAASRTSAAMHDGAVWATAYFDDRDPVCTYTGGGPLKSPLDPAVGPPVLTGRCTQLSSRMLQRGADAAPHAPDYPSAASVAVQAAGDPVVVAPDGTAVRLGWDGGQRALLGDASWASILAAGAGR